MSTKCIKVVVVMGEVAVMRVEVARRAGAREKPAKVVVMVVVMILAVANHYRRSQFILSFHNIVRGISITNT